LFVLRRNLGLLNPVRHGLFAWQLASHKLCRWLVPFAMMSAAAANLMLASRSPWYLAAGILQGLFYVAALMGLWTGARRLRFPAFLLLANVSVLIAWVRFTRGDRIVSWTPSQRINALPA